MTKINLQALLEENIEENPNLIAGDYNLRNCPSCDLQSLKGMPGGRDATCQNCGYKDPCCYD